MAEGIWREMIKLCLINTKSFINIELQIGSMGLTWAVKLLSTGLAPEDS